MEVLTLDDFVFGRAPGGPAADQDRPRGRGGRCPARNGAASARTPPVLADRTAWSAGCRRSVVRAGAAGYRLHRMEPEYPEVELVRAGAAAEACGRASPGESSVESAATFPRAPGPATARPAALSSAILRRFVRPVRRGARSSSPGRRAPRSRLTRQTRLEAARWSRAHNLHLLGGRAYFCFQRGLETWLAGADPDALVLEANPRYLSSPRAIDWMERRGRRVLGWGLGAPKGGFLSGWFRRRFLQRLSGVIAYSTRGASQYAAAGVPVDRIWVAPNAVEPPLAKPLRATDGPPAGPSHLRRAASARASASRRCSAACAAVTPRAGVVDRRGWTGSRTIDLHRRTSAPEGRLHRGRPRPRTARRCWMRPILFVLPGTGGLALQQALARGLPVIAAEGDGSQEDMVTPSNGWLVPPGESGALASTPAVRGERSLSPRAPWGKPRCAWRRRVFPRRSCLRSLSGPSEKGWKADRAAGFCRRRPQSYRPKLDRVLRASWTGGPSRHDASLCRNSRAGVARNRLPMAGLQRRGSATSAQSDGRDHSAALDRSMDGPAAGGDLERHPARAQAGPGPRAAAPLRGDAGDGRASAQRPSSFRPGATTSRFTRRRRR